MLFLCEPGFGSSARAARAVRMKMSKEEVTAANVRNASTLILLRIRALNTRSVYERLWCSHVEGEKVPFLYDSKEEDGDDGSRINESKDYVTRHVRVVADFRGKAERSPRSKAAWKKCNQGGGSRKRILL